MGKCIYIYMIYRGVRGGVGGRVTGRCGLGNDSNLKRFDFNGRDRRGYGLHLCDSFEKTYACYILEIYMWLLLRPAAKLFGHPHL